MKAGKKLLTGALLILCGALLALCIVFAVGWSKAAKTTAALPEVLNNGTAIQWKYADENKWHDLVELTELRGVDGENGKDGVDGIDGKNGTNGKNGTDGKDGIDGIDGKYGTDGKDGIDGINGKDGIDGSNGADGKTVEVRKTETAIQWRYENGSWQDLAALADITGPVGQVGANGKAAEFQTENDMLRWRYKGDSVWLNLYDLSHLRGQDGNDGKDGINGNDGKDGDTPFIGSNDNWWIGETDTGMKAAGQDGKDGIDGVNGVNGKNGIDGKNIEVKRTDSYIQWRYEGEDWQNLVALADIEGPTGQKGADGANGKTPEFRVNENALQWRYNGDEIWLNLYDLSVLKGIDGRDGTDGKNGEDGSDGKNGVDGKNGNTPFIGDNGNWWIGETDTGVKAAGDKGDKGDKGDTGPAGPAGKDGSCPGWFYGTGQIEKIGLPEMDGGAVGIGVTERINRGGLVSWSGLSSVTLKKGHIYHLDLDGSIQVLAYDEKTGNYSVQMSDGYEDDFCRELTRIKRDGRKLTTGKEQHSLGFNRIYDATEQDITLTFRIEQSGYDVYLVSFNCTMFITALN